MKVIGIAVAALALVAGAVAFSQPTQAQAPLPACDPAAPVFPCNGGTAATPCIVFVADGVCWPPAGSLVPAPPAPTPEPVGGGGAGGPLPSVIGDPQPWTDPIAPFPPFPFGG